MLICTLWDKFQSEHLLPPMLSLSLSTDRGSLPTQCDQIGQVIKDLDTNFLTKNSPNIGQLLRILQKKHLPSETAVDTFWAFSAEYWATIYSDIGSQCSYRADNQEFSNFFNPTWFFISNLRWRILLRGLRRRRRRLNLLLRQKSLKSFQLQKSNWNKLKN